MLLGNVTLSFDRIGGKLETSGAVEQQVKNIDVDGIRQTYADFCARDTYATDAAMHACDAGSTSRLLDRLGVSAAGERTSQGIGYIPPAALADGLDAMAAAVVDAITVGVGSSGGMPIHARPPPAPPRPPRPPRPNLVDTLRDRFNIRR